ncbi:transcriptional repressor [candidate division NPL-UPA2 bacterium Unc8]|uniref:Transcriptional repressor n=1 Tax=candidate division NPL-UPA2 bacterium Unc8 TaxID=1980939 RepID=A0A399FUL6_UNCN2|nr:Ferric uptake regulation protein [Bacillota bacterium]RIH99720.1 MAG: transcriptional repressor [candidate division NPL-UPA2 bacterium Unc8]
MRIEKDKLRDYLRVNGLKFTPQRQLILKEAFSTHRHFEVDDLFIRIRRQDKQIARSTIYRTLRLLLECGLLREVFFEEKHSHYEHILGHEHHDHLLCLKCKRVIEFSNGSIENLQEKVCREHEFQFKGHRLQIMGYCSRCQ